MALTLIHRNPHPKSNQGTHPSWGAEEWQRQKLTYNQPPPSQQHTTGVGGFFAQAVPSQHPGPSSPVSPTALATPDSSGPGLWDTISAKFMDKLHAVQASAESFTRSAQHKMDGTVNSSHCNAL